MIDYETYCRIRHLDREGTLSYEQIAQELQLHAQTVSRYAVMESYPRRRHAKRASKLDAYKPMIVIWLERYPYSAAQVYQRLKNEHAYSGGASIVKDYVRAVRPVRRAAFLTLAFAPGEAAQVDWGYAGTITLGGTQRRVSFFVMVLCHSRLAYVEFTIGEGMEHFLSCHANAFEFFGGTPGAVIIDNLKTGVLRHPLGEKAVFHPGYLDFAGQYGFEPRACTVRKANEGKVERLIKTIQRDFEMTLRLENGHVHSVAELNTAFSRWIAATYHLRVHSSTDMTPHDRFTRHAHPLRAVEQPDKIDPLFYTRLERTVRKDGTVTLGKKLFEVNLAMRALKVELRFDPILMDRVEVWHKASFHGVARPADLHLNSQIHNRGHNYER